LDLINSGELWRTPTNWAEFISDRENHFVKLEQDPGTDDLSEFEMELIQSVYKQFGSMDQWQLRDWCHQHCGEWSPLDQGCKEITLSRMAEEVGQDPEQIELEASEHFFVERALSF
jgi:Protein of unknown function (DUF4065)